MRADREAGGEGAEADADEEQPDGVRHVEPAEERLAERAEEDGEEEEGGFPLEQVAPRRFRPVAAVVATGVIFGGGVVSAGTLHACTTVQCSFRPCPCSRCQP